MGQVLWSGMSVRDKRRWKKESQKCQLTYRWPQTSMMVREYTPEGGKSPTRLFLCQITISKVEENGPKDIHINTVNHRPETIVNRTNAECMSLD